MSKHITMNPNWFLGFLEGEGTFTINFSTRRYTSVNKGAYRIVNPKLVFIVCSAEKKLLTDTKDFLFNNNINAIIAERPYKDAYLNLKKIPKIKKRHWWLIVSEKTSIFKLMSLLDKLEWHSEKLLDFEVWKKASSLVYRRPCTKKDLIKIAKLIQKSRHHKGPPRKWTPEFIEENCVEVPGGRVKVERYVRNSG